MASTTERPAGPPGGQRRWTFTRKLADTICARVAAGEAMASITDEPDMPSRWKVAEWAREIPAFGAALERAKAEGGRSAMGGPVSVYSPAVSHEICRRIAEGESVSSICRDPAMPSFSSVYLWRRNNRAFAEAVRVAREAQAERFCDRGWELAQDATPETAYLTHVRLTQLRWMAAALGPRSYGRLRPQEPDVEPPQKTLLFRNFQLETDEAAGLCRVVGYTPDPVTLKMVRTSEGKWEPLPPGHVTARRESAAGDDA